MADIALRFHGEPLVLTSSVESALERRETEPAINREMLLLFEQDTVEDAMRSEAMAGAQCVVAYTHFMTPARLRAHNAADDFEALAWNAVELAHVANPQHVLVELGPCGLPLDDSMPASVKENVREYKTAAEVFEKLNEPEAPQFDAYFLNGFASIADLSCALSGVKEVASVPVFASFDVDTQGNLPSGETCVQAAKAAVEGGADVIGYCTGASAEQSAAIAHAIREEIGDAVPLLAQFWVGEVNKKQHEPTAENPYPVPETLIAAKQLLRAQGVQFLRACGNATPAYTATLVY